MTETRFPSSGLSAEYGDIVISEVTVSAAVAVRKAGTVILSEVYVPDANDQITIKGIGELAMLYFTPGNLLTDTGSDAAPVYLTVDVVADTTISKVVTIYPCVVDFAGTLDAATLLHIPLSRANIKQTGPGRKEFISFYGNSNVKIYAVYMGLSADQGVTDNLITLANANEIYTVDVSPAIIAERIGQPVAKLVYYNVYTSEDAIIRYMVSGRNWQFEKTFVFRNCFGAQESFTCTGDEVVSRKWTREFGNINLEKIDFSRDIEKPIKINTGFVTSQDVDVVEDMLNSDDICVIDNSVFQKVTILDEEFNESSRKDEVNSVTFTYRKSRQGIVSSYTKHKRTRVFSNEFDSSFE